MKKQIEMMEEFHRAFGHPINQPSLILNSPPLGLDFVKLRERLHNEETKELNNQLWDDFGEGKISPNLLKEGADLLYVLLGTFVSLGLGNELEEAFKRVHESNMSKLGEDGKPIYRDDGKVLKGPNYKPPELDDLVDNSCNLGFGVMCNDYDLSCQGHCKKINGSLSTKTTT